MTDGSSQSAIDLRCKNARDPRRALHLNQTRLPCTGCCFSHNRMLAVIMPECAGGVAAPEFIKLLDYSENRAWTWPCELDPRCLGCGTCHPNRIIVSPTEHAIGTPTDAVPILEQPYRTRPFKREIIADHVNKKFKLKVIEPTHSTWESLVVIAP